MKFIKVILVIIALLLVITLGFGVYIWVQLQGFKENSANYSNTASQTTSNTGEGASVSAKSITVDVSSLPETQQKVLKTLGFDAPSYTITPEMMVCAEAKLGAARVEEIAQGASVSTLEAISLAACLK